MSTGVALLIALVLLIANGFFVAVEFGLIATQRAQLEDKANEGNRRAKRALTAITDLNIQIAGAQLGSLLQSAVHSGTLDQTHHEMQARPGFVLVLGQRSHL